jgi:prepilin-type N-terminal cleavage/methylation domain-containing protein
MILRSPRRPGFTLLEVLLASALAVVLMAALYVALDVQLRLAADGRDAIDQATLTRAVVQRFETDLGSSIGPTAPVVTNSSSSSSGSSSTTPMSGMGTGTGGSTTTDSTVVMEEETETDAPAFQAGVIGESEGENRPRLTIYVARVASMQKDGESSGPAASADIRRITYWMTDGGLARQEVPLVTSTESLASTEPQLDGKDESSFVIASEVQQLMIEYWDGSAWTETWDGREPGADGKTPKGPPAAIRIRFWIKVPGPEIGEFVDKEFRHTIAVRSAPGPAVPETPAADPATGSGQ